MFAKAQAAVRTVAWLIHSLVVRRIPPGLAVACNEVSRVLDSRDPAHLRSIYITRCLKRPRPRRAPGSRRRVKMPLRGMGWKLHRPLCPGG
jgi:hypothetical protein